MKTLKTFSVSFEGDILVDARDQEEAIQKAAALLGKNGHERAEFISTLHATGASEPDDYDIPGCMYKHPHSGRCEAHN